MGGPFQSDAIDLTPKRVSEMHGRGDIQLIDVREPYEWEAGRIAGARHIPLEHLASQSESIDAGRPIVFYCRLGARSGMATQAFRASGYDALNMAGGITAWAKEGLPLVPEGGFVADHAPPVDGAPRATRAPE